LGGNGDRAAITSGTLYLAVPALRNANSLSRNVSVVRGDGCSSAWGSLMELLDGELTGSSPGGLLLASQIVGVMLGWLHDGFDAGASVAAADRVVEAIVRMHLHPDRSWSIDELAEISGMSRSGFTRYFKCLTAESPMQYLQRCRLARAAGFLERGDARLLQIAEWTGYQSDVALSKAFKRRFGVSPGGYRKAARISGQRNAQPAN
jgi:AraC-like DNA-binding protein